MNVSECSSILALYNKQQQLKQSSSACASVCAASNTIHFTSQKEFSNGQKLGIGACSVLGVAASLAMLAKFGAKKSLTPKTIIKNGWKNSYLRNAQFRSGSIIAMVIGSVAGGLAGGAIFDKEESFRTKKKEALTQVFNASIPIIFVESATKLADKFSEKVMPNWSKSTKLLEKAVAKLPAAVGALGALVAGVYTANAISGKVNEKFYNEKTDRNVKLTDFTVHVDDLGVAATFVLDEKNPVTKFIQKCIPIAMCIPGYETGIARSKNTNV